MQTASALAVVEVEQPGGELIAYRVMPVPAGPHDWRAWRVFSPKGDAYTVTEPPAGPWRCTCPADNEGKRRGGRWQTIDAWACCKHAGAIHQWLAEQEADHGTDRQTRNTCADEGLAHEGRCCSVVRVR